MGVDFGNGAAIFVDGKEFYTDRSNLWWSANWNAGKAVLKVMKDYDPGRHKIEIYGIEDCCDGNFNVRFEKNGNTGWLPMSKFEEEASDIDRSTSCWDVQVETRKLVNKLNKHDKNFGNKADEFYNDLGQPTGFCTFIKPHWPVTNKKLCNGPNRDIARRITVNWFDDEKTDWQFKLGLDFGEGFVAYIDDKIIYVERGNIWGY